MSSQVAPTDKPRVVPDASDVANQFITQYYTLLHQDPSQLFRLYYDRSTLVFGTESDGEVSPVFGTEAIKSTISQAGFENCKVCVSNYDGQLSAGNGILIQVLGEISSNDGPWRRFSQTFFLADEGGRYWILNDMFRYLKSDVQQEEIAEDVDQAIDTEVAQAEHDGTLVAHDKDITLAVQALQAQPGNALPPAPEAQQPAIESSAPAAEASAPAAEKQEEEAAYAEPAVAAETEAAPAAETKEEAVPALAADDAPATVTEIPDTPAEKPAEETPAESAAPSKPSKPTSWANLAATNANKWNQAAPAQTKVVPQPRPNPTPKQSKPATPTSGAQTPNKPAPKPTPQRVPGASVHVRNTEKVKADQLKAAMAAFGTVLNVSVLPPGNRAYVDFGSPEEAQKAVAHSEANSGVPVDGHNVLVQAKSQVQRGPNLSRASQGSGRRGGRGGAQAAR